MPEGSSYVHTKVLTDLATECKQKGLALDKVSRGEDKNQGDLVTARLILSMLFASSISTGNRI